MAEETLSRQPPVRRPLAVMLAVWKALFLRELLNRVTRERFAWAWMLVEPIAHIAILGWMITQGFRNRTVAGGDPLIFIILGILGFFMTRNMMSRGIDAVESNSALFAFRQVKPVDTIFARALNTGFLEIMIFSLIFAGAGLMGLNILPKDPLLAFTALFALWLLGLGLGLALSVPCILIPELGHIVRLAMTPLYFFSAVIFPSVRLPLGLRDVLMWNPILHGLESLRIGFMPTYIVPPGISLLYVFACAVPLIFIGLAFHVHFRTQLMTR
jgi:capsular polysaccharide transport system permease protein